MRLSRNHARPAFTLIEVLVVIGIIALLIGILVPSLAMARGAAHAAVNSANLRSLGQAVTIYSADHEIYPGLRLSNAPDGSTLTHIPTGKQKFRWHWAIGDYVGPPYTPKTPDEVADFATLENIPRLDNEVFLDPSQSYEDMRRYNKPGNPIQALRNGSYGYNFQYLGNSRVEAGRWVNYPVTDAKIRNHTRTIAFADSAGAQPVRRSTGFREHTYTIDPPRLDPERTRSLDWGSSTGPVPASARHRGKATVVFLDGHVERLTLAELGYVYEAGTGGEWIVEGVGDNGLWNGLGYDPAPTTPSP